MHKFQDFKMNKKEMKEKFSFFECLAVKSSQKESDEYDKLYDSLKK